MKKHGFIWLICTLAVSQFAIAQNRSTEGWKDVRESAIRTTATRYIVPEKYRTLKLNLSAMRSFLQTLPLEQNYQAPANAVLMQFPMPDGSSQLFRVYEAPIMERGLQLQFPTIKTYAGYGVTDGTASIRFDLTPQGFHAMILSAKGTVFIDPYAHLQTQYYISYYKKDYRNAAKHFECGLINDEQGMEDDQPQQQQLLNNGGGPPLQAIDLGDIDAPVSVALGNCVKRTYRLALSATGEYTTFHGGTLALAQAAQVTTMNRVNGVYAREVAVQLNIIANNNLIVYTNAGSDPFTNGNPGTMIGQNQTNTTTVIGSANYDIGHVFGTNSGGLAGLGVICSSGNKARGVTGSSAPVGDPFDIDYVAHEMGHQFGANHTFNGTAGSCSGNGNSSTAYEPGSGTTIMAYAGICGAQDVQNNSDDYFHLASLIEINAHITGSGGTCAVQTSLSNTGPTVTSTHGYKNIPRSTPFMLTATATDPNAADTLTYCWEQYNSTASTQPPVATSTAGPNFRSRDPLLSGTRYMPRLQDLVPNAATPWEVLPSVTRNMAFRVTVRDNHAGGGCNAYDTVTVAFTSTSGPFVVNYPTNTGVSWPALSTQTVTWAVASTTAAPVSCVNVDIFLSTDGGYTYPTTLATAVTNNGSYTVTVPNLPTTTARIMVKGNGNIFFDISNNNFAITAAVTPDYTLAVTNATVTVCKPTSAVQTVTVGQILNYTSPVTLSVTGLPAGATSSFSTNPVTPAGSSTLTIGNIAAVAVGSYTVTVNSTSASGNKTASFTLVVNDVPAVPVLATPANAATGVANTPTLMWGAVTGASVYTVQVATDTGFTNIVATSTAAGTSYTVSPALSSSTTYYWRARASNSCGNSAYAVRFMFTTGNIVCFTYTSTDVPKTISQNGTPTVTSVLTVPNNGTITDVNVTNLVGTHSYIQDLRFTLRSPANTNVILMNQVCGSQNNFNIKFDDAATNTYASIPCPPTSGSTYVPNQALSAFNGQTANGTWSMVINDLSNNDGGSLTAWSIQICMSVPCAISTSTSSTNASCPTTANGSATVTPTGGLAPYTYAWSSGATTASASNLLPGTYTVTVTDINTCNATASVTVGSTNPAVVPAVSISASATTICAGTSVTFTATPTNGGASPAYQWKRNNVNIGGATASTYTTTTLVNGDVITVTLTSNAACASPATATSTGITMVVNPTVVPAISIVASQNPVCAGTNVTFTATPTNGGTTPAYQWRLNGVNIGGATSATYTTNTLATGNIISCVLTSNAACANPSTATSNNITMTVNAVVTPLVTIAASQNNVCAGTSITFTATPTNGGSAPAYQWFNNGVLIAGATAVTYTSAALTNGSVISAVMTSNAACTTVPTDTSNLVSMIINPAVLPTLVISASATAICSGQSVTFSSVITNGGAAPAYQWKKNNVNIGGAIAATYTTTVIANGDVFTCTLTSNAACASPATVTSNSITMTVSGILVPAISISTPNNNICAGATVNFTATPTNGGATPAYQWRLNGNPIGGATAATYSSNTLISGDVISCVLTSSLACASPTTATSNSITLTVQPFVTPDVSISISQNNVCAGTTVNFTATPTNGGNTPAYQWQVNGVNVAGATAATYSSAALANGNVVRVVLNSTATCASPVADTSNSITMVITPLVTPTISISAAQNNVCAGTTVNFTSTITNGGAAPAYQWKKNNVNIGGANAATYSSNTLANGDVITCVLTSNAACASPTSATSNAVTMVINPIVVPTVSISTTNTTVCAGTTVTFNATVTNGGASPQYAWTVNGNSAGTNSASFSSSTLPNGAVVQCALTSNAVCASPATASSNSITITVQPTVVPDVNISASQNGVCAGTSITFTAVPTNGGSAPAYQWQLNGINVSGATAATYSSAALANGNVVRVVLNSTATCASPTADTSNAITMVITPLVTPTISISTAQNNVCAGTTVNFTSTIANGGAGAQYQWKKNNVNIGGATTSTYSSNTLANGDVITCVLTSNAACASPTSVTSNSVVMVINPLVVPTISISTGNNTVCAGSTVTFTTSITNGGASPQYAWTVNGSSAGGNAASFSSSTLTNGAVVQCTLTSNALCASPAIVASNSITITVQPTVIPDVNISASQNGVCAGTSITLTAIPTNGGSAPAYQWQLNGVNISGANAATYSTTSFTNGNVVRCVLNSNANCAAPVSDTSNTVTMSITPSVLPSITVSASATGICAGTIVNFSSSVSNAGSTPVYQWQLNGGNISGANASTYSSSSLNNADVVTCTLTSNATCAAPATVSSNSVTMSVNAVVTPTINISTTSGAVCAGSTILFTSTVTNAGGNPLYQWQVNGNNAGSNSAQFSASNFSNGDVVTCQLSSSAACALPAIATSNNITVSVLPAVVPAVSVTATPSGSICSGETVTFLSTVSNAGSSAVYVWRVNGIVVGNSSNSYNTAALNNGDIITCELTSSEPCASPQTVTSAGVTISVKPTPATPIVTSNSPVCSNEELQLFTTGITGATYIWTGPNGFTSGSQFPVVSNPVAGTYSVVVSDNGCPSNQGSTNVAVNMAPTVPNILVAGASLSSSATQGNQWYGSGQPISGATDQFFTATQAGWYYVVVTDANGCTAASDSVFMDVLGVETLNTSAVLVYPNPVSHTLQVQLPSSIQEAQLQLHNDIGQLMLAQHLLQHHNTVNVQALSAGVYFLTVTVQSQSYRQKVVVE